MSGECEFCSEHCMDCECFYKKEEAMIIKRKPKETDQENVEKCIKSILKMISYHPQMDANLWAAAMWTLLTENYRRSGCEYGDFCKELMMISKHYKFLWDDENN